MKLFNGLTAGASLAAVMALSTPARAHELLGSERLDQGYAKARPTAEDKKDDKKKKKKSDKDKEAHCGADKGKHEGACGGKDGEKKGDKEGGCGEGTCG